MLKVILPVLAILIIGIIVQPSLADSHHQTEPVVIEWEVGEKYNGKRAVIDIDFTDSNHFEKYGVNFNITATHNNKVVLDVANFTTGPDDYQVSFETSTMPQDVSVNKPLEITVFVFTTENGEFTFNTEHTWIGTVALIKPSVVVTSDVDVLTSPGGRALSWEVSVDVEELGITGGYDISASQGGNDLYDITDFHNEPWGVNPFKHWLDELEVAPSTQTVTVQVVPLHGQPINIAINSP